MKTTHRMRGFTAVLLALALVIPLIPTCSAAASTSSQVVQNAQNLYDEIKENYGGIQEYVLVLNNRKLSYQKTLINAEFYDTVYQTIVDMGSTSMSLICGIVTGDVLGTVKDEAAGLLIDRMINELPKFTIEQYIYSQAKAGASQVNLTELMDIGFRIENECHGRVSSVKDAIRFIRINQEIKMGFAALGMGRDLYYEQLNASPWNALIDMFTHHSLGYLTEGLGGNLLDQYRYNVTAETVFDLLVTVMDTIHNRHITKYMESIIEISKETTALIAYDVDDFGKDPAVPPSASAPNPPAAPQAPAPSLPAVTYVNCHYKCGPYNEGTYEGEWSDGKPNGWGKLKYDGFDDGKFYSFTDDDGTVIKAISYEGNFVDGHRVGYGIVEYEHGYVEEGTFGGLWQVGKLVFEGKRWLKAGEQKVGYWDITMRCTDWETASEQKGPWVSTRQTCSIVYDANGGQGAPPADVKTKDDVLSLPQEIPTRAGYTFLGWSADASASGETYRPGDFYTGNSDATLYAVWKANTFTVSYDANGGRNVPAPQTKASGETLTLSSAAPVREGYRFLGWSTSPTAGSAGFRAGGPFDLNADTVLYAVWTEVRPADAFSQSLPSPWAQDAVMRAYAMGLLPDSMREDYSRTAARIDFVRLAYNVIEARCGAMPQLLYRRGLIADPQQRPALVFIDVSWNCGYDDNDWYRVAALHALGIVNGVEDNWFEPGRPITREEAAAMLSRVCSFLERGYVAFYDSSTGPSGLYADNAAISSWAFFDVYHMRAIGVMNGVGDNRFAPKEGHTIEESIVTFMRLMDRLS